MRTILTAASLAIATAGLAGCGGSDESFRAEYRTRAVEACASGARASPNAAAAQSAGVNLQRVCECAVDRHLANNSTAALRGEKQDTAAPAGAQTAMIQCLTEFAPGGAGQGRGVGSRLRRSPSACPPSTDLDVKQGPTASSPAARASASRASAGRRSG